MLRIVAERRPVPRAATSDEFDAAGSRLGALNDSMGYLLRRTQLEHLRQFANDIGKKVAIRPGAFSVLVLAGANPGIDQMRIAQLLGLDKANVAAAIRDMAAAGWLTRRRIARDRRCQGVFLTPSGVVRLAALKREMRQFERRFCAPLSEPEHTMLLRLLRRLCFQRFGTV